jgi:hypothetical protein
LKRFTNKTDDGNYYVSDENIINAINRLGLFENAYEDLINNQTQIPKDLQELRLQGKEKTVRYKETMAQKLINNHIITFFEKYGFKQS